jgi:hypothetical protein
VQEETDSYNKENLKKVGFVLLKLKERRCNSEDQTDQSEEHNELEGIVFHFGNAIENQTDLNRESV